MYLCFSVLSFRSQLTNVACLICLMPYLYPSERTSIFVFLDSFSILCFLFPLQSWFLPIWVFNSLFHVSPCLQLSFVFSFWTSSFLFGSLPLISQTFSHEIGEGPCCLSPPPTCHVQSFHQILLCFVYHLILQQFSISSPFSSLPTSHQTSLSPAMWLEPFSIWTKISIQSLRSRHSPTLLTSELTAAATQKQWVCSPRPKTPEQLETHSRTKKITKIMMSLFWHIL